MKMKPVKNFYDMQYSFLAYDTGKETFPKYSDPFHLMMCDYSLVYNSALRAMNEIMSPFEYRKRFLQLCMALS